MPQPFQYIPLSIIEPITPQKLASGGALTGQVPVWSGSQYIPLNPISAYSNGALLGRVSEINLIGGSPNITGGNRLNIIVGGVTVNGQAVTAINPGTNMTASIVSGVATLNVSTTTTGIGLYNTLVSNGLVASPGVSTSHNIKSLVQGNNMTITDFGTYLRLDAGTFGAITGISINGAGNYQDIQIGSGLQVLGNVISAAASNQTTLTHLGFGSPIFTGSAPSYMMKGIRSISSGLSIVDTGQTIDLQLTGGSLINVYGNGTFLGAFPGINFEGFASVTSSGGNARVIAPPSGVSSLANGTNTTAVNLGGGVWRIDASVSGGGGASSIAILNNGAFFMPTVTTLDIWGATSLQDMGGGMARLVLPNGGGGGITGISINYAGNYNNIVFTGAGVSVAGNTININGGGGGGLTGTSGNGLTVGTNSVSLGLATMFSAGAMPVLSGIVNQYLAGNGTWQAVPSGGSMPSGFNTAIMYHDGTQWLANPTMRLTSVTPFFGSNWRLTNLPGITTHGLTFATSIQLTSESHLYLSSNIGDVRITSASGTIQCAGNSFSCTTSSMGFFGVSPISRPTTTNDITSVRNALIALGLIQ
jgi:hypothetical protein